MRKTQEGAHLAGAAGRCAPRASDFPSGPPAAVACEMTPGGAYSLRGRAASERAGWERQQRYEQPVVPRARSD